MIPPWSKTYLTIPIRGGNTEQNPADAHLKCAAVCKKPLWRELFDDVVQGEQGAVPHYVVAALHRLKQGRK